VSCRVIISSPDTREDNETIEEDDVPEVQSFWQQMMAEFGSEKRYLEQIIDDFERNPHPEIIICVNKLLTGFDALATRYSTSTNGYRITTSYRLSPA